MQNRIKPIKTSLFKRVMKFLFYRQLMILIIMQKFDCTRKQAKTLYSTWSDFNR